MGGGRRRLSLCIFLSSLWAWARAAGGLYELLNVTSTASSKDIRKAYHRAALLTHPDKVRAAAAAETDTYTATPLPPPPPTAKCSAGTRRAAGSIEYCA